LRSKVEEVKSIFLQYNFGSLSSRDKSMLLTLITLKAGSYITREMISASKSLAGQLAAASGIERGKWEKKLSRLLLSALLITKSYQSGAGICFLLLYPGQLFCNRPSDIARIIRRSITKQNYTP